MGSNQGKQPHHADRGGKVWSRDEKRENRKTMRGARDRAAIADSVSSTEHLDDDDWEVCDHELDENGWCPCDIPHTRRKHRRPSAKWCRRKEGREHEFFFLSKSALGWLDIYACAVCGKKKYIKSGGHPNP